MRVLFSFILVLAFCSCWVSPLYAMGVTPTRFELTANPKDEVTDAIQVINNSHEPIHIKVMLLDFIQKDRHIIQGVKASPVSCASWIRFTPNEFNLSPNDKTYVRFTLSVPEKVSGEYQTSLRLEELPQIRPEQTGMILGVRVNLPIYVKINGTENPHCTITKLTIAHAPVAPVLKFDYPLFIRVEVKNDGNVHLRPNGLLSVREKKTEKVAYEQALQNDEPVLPGNTITLETGLKEWQRILSGEYEASVSLHYFDSAHEVRGKKSFKVLSSGEIIQ